MDDDDEFVEPVRKQAVSPVVAHKLCLGSLPVTIREVKSKTGEQRMLNFFEARQLFAWSILMAEQDENTSENGSYEQPSQ
jgi:hypothetical protein